MKLTSSTKYLSALDIQNKVNALYDEIITLQTQYRNIRAELNEVKESLMRVSIKERNRKRKE